MKEIFEFALSQWGIYWGESWYPYLFLAALAALLVIAIWKKEARFLAAVTLSLLLLIFCPISAWVISRLMGRLIYWRVLWLLPITPVLCYALTEGIRHLPGKWLRAAVTVAVCVLLGVSGTFQPTSGNFYITHNAEQVPDEIVTMSRVIVNDLGENETALVAANDYLCSYLRVYDPNLLLPYGRFHRDAISEDASELYVLMETMGDPGAAAQTAQRVGCNYMIADIANPGTEEALNQHGYRTLAIVEHYAVLRADETGVQKSEN